MNITIDSFRPFIAWVIGAAVAAIANFILDHYHYCTSHEVQEHITQFITLTILFIVGKSCSKWFNPGDAASSHLIAVQREVVKQVKEDIANVKK